MSAKIAKGLQKNGVDMISNLPENIQAHILSFLDVKQAVQTCVLSRTWRYVWREISCVNFDFQLFECAGYAEDRRGCFEYFVYNFISRHRGGVSKLRFSGDRFEGFCPFFVSKIVSFAASKGVEDLELNLCGEDLFDFPACFYQCQSLRSVSLVHRDVISFKPFTHPSVRTLFLRHDEHEDYVEGAIIYNCPSLEHLSLANYELDAKIAAPNLKTLELWGAYENPIQMAPSLTSKVAISAPCLDSVKLYSIIPEISLQEHVSCVVNLEIMHPFQLPYQQFNDAQVCLLKLVNVLKQLRGARSLTISLVLAELLSNTPAVLCDWEHYLLHDVRHLTFTTEMDNPCTSVLANLGLHLILNPDILESIKVKVINHAGRWNVHNYGIAARFD